MRRVKRIISWVLIVTGLVLVAAGLRTVFLSYWGQQREAEVEIPQPPPGVEQPPLPPHYQPGDFIGRLSIPRLDARWMFYEGTGTGELERGPGHMEGSADPGSHGNCVIAGHRDTHFRVLKDIQRGDDIMVESANGSYLYRVTDLKVVSPNNTKPIQPAPQATLTLVTCFPFYYVGPAPKRFIVKAELIGPGNPSNASQPAKTPGSTPG